MFLWTTLLTHPYARHLQEPGSREMGLESETVTAQRQGGALSEKGGNGLKGAWVGQGLRE